MLVGLQVLVKVFIIVRILLYYNRTASHKIRKPISSHCAIDVQLIFMLKKKSNLHNLKCKSTRHVDDLQNNNSIMEIPWATTTTVYLLPRLSLCYSIVCLNKFNKVKTQSKQQNQHKPMPVFMPIMCILCALYNQI